MLANKDGLLSVQRKIVFDFRSVFVYSEDDIDGSGAGNDRSLATRNCAGKPKKGLHLCGQWPTVWVTSYRGLRGLECVPEKGCILAQHIATGQVAVVCEKGQLLAIGS